MLGLVARDWWVFAIRGIAALVFGILAFIWPETTLTVLVFLFGAYVLVDGVSLLIALARGDAVARRHAWAVAIIGVLGIVVGVVTFAWPGLTALSLLYLVAFWAIATGTFQVIAAVALRRELDNEFWMAVGGVASIVFGALLVASPGDGLISLVWLVGIWSVVFGVSSLGLAYRLHEIDAALPKLASARRRTDPRPATVVHEGCHAPATGWTGQERGGSGGNAAPTAASVRKPLPPVTTQSAGRSSVRVDPGGLPWPELHASVASAERELADARALGPLADPRRTAMRDALAPLMPRDPTDRTRRPWVVARPSRQDPMTPVIAFRSYGQTG